MIRERLDPAMANAFWVSKFSTITTIHKLMIGPDHYPVVVTLEPTDQRGRKHFRFEKSWLEHQECGKIVKNSWAIVQNGERRPGFHDKLGRCITKVQSWS